MKKISAIVFALLVAAPALALDTNLAFRIDSEVQTTGMQSLPDLTWIQGSTPAIECRILRAGKASAISTNTRARMLISTSIYTGSVWSVVTNTVLTTNATASSYWFQWGAIGTNSCLSNSTTAQPWGYTIYFEDGNGACYWNGAGNLYIERSTSVDNGLTWQSATGFNSVAWANLYGSPTNNADLMELLAASAGEDATARASIVRVGAAATNAQVVASNAAAGVVSVGAVASGAVQAASAEYTATVARANAAYGWGNHGLAGYLTAESDPAFDAWLAGDPLDGFLSAEADPAFSASAAYGITTNLIANWNAAHGWGDHAAAGYLLPYSEIEIEGIPEPIGLWMFSESSGVVYLKNYSGSDGQTRMLNFDNGYVSGPWTLFGSNRFEGVLSFVGSAANSLRNFIGSTSENSPQVLSADSGIVTVWSTGRVEQIRVATGTETVRFARAAASLSNSAGTIFHFCCGTNFVSFEPTNMTGFSTTGIYTNGMTNTAVVVWQPNSSNAHWRLAVP